MSEPRLPGLKRREWLVQISAAAAGLWASSLPSVALAAETRTIYVQPLGQALPQADVQFVVRALRAFYPFEVSMLPRVALPPSAFYRPRSRYRAEKLLDFLTTRLPEGGFRMLGLTGVDISTTKPPHEDWGILGLATIDGTTCVLSSHRCARGARQRDVPRQRLGKVAVHEIGHTLSLEHCPNFACLMEDALGSVLTTDREYDLCADCRGKLARAGFTPNATPDIPWPKP